MAKTTAERQRKYRTRRQQLGDDRRLNTWISSQAYSALERLSEHCGSTKREIIEQLLIRGTSNIHVKSRHIL